jgi:hypothetical protein
VPIWTVDASAQTYGGRVPFPPVVASTRIGARENRRAAQRRLRRSTRSSASARHAPRGGDGDLSRRERQLSGEMRTRPIRSCRRTRWGFRKRYKIPKSPSGPILFILSASRARKAQHAVELFLPPDVALGKCSADVGWPSDLYCTRDVGAIQPLRRDATARRAARGAPAYVQTGGFFAPGNCVIAVYLMCQSISGCAYAFPAGFQGLSALRLSCVF